MWASRRRDESGLKKPRDEIGRWSTWFSVVKIVTGKALECRKKKDLVLPVHDGLKVVQWADTTRSGRGPGFAANLPDLGDRAVRPRFCDRPNRARQEGRLCLVGFHRIVINR